MTHELLALMLPAVFLGIGLIIAMFKWPKVWIGVVILSTPWFLSDTGKGLSITEVLLGGFIIGSVVAWVVTMAFSGRLKLTWIGEKLLIFFLALSVLNIIVAVFNFVDPVDWLFEWMIFLLVLYYFPIKEYYGKDEKSLKQLLVLLGIAMLLMGAYTAYDFKTRSSEGLVYAYQLINARSRLFAPAFSLGLILSAAIAFHVKTWRMRALVLLFALLSGAGLLQSMTRSLWVASAFCLVILMFFLRPRHNIALVSTIVVVAAAAYLTASSMYPGITKIALKILEKRVTSSTQLTGGDYSFETRLIEAEEASRWIKENPLAGNGLRAELLSWGPIERFHWKKPFIHIGYISLLFKFGIPITLVVMGYLFAFTGRSIKDAFLIRSSWKAPPIVKGVAIGAAVFMPALYITITVAGFVDQRYGNMLLAVLFALVTISHDLLGQYRQQEEAATA